MIAGIYNLFCEQGTTFTRLIEIEYPDDLDPTIFHPYPLDGFTASLQVRRTVESTSTLVSLTTHNGGIELQPAGIQNGLRLYMSPTVTASIASDGVYDLEIEDENGDVSRVLRGTFTLSPQVTR
jgi:hypothetical protein